MRKAHGPLRADTLRHSMNGAKERVVLGFIRDYRRAAVEIGKLQWRIFFETGSTNKYAPAKYLNHICGAAPVQMAGQQVQEQIDSWLSNRANDFVDCVVKSRCPDPTKRQLFTINRQRGWFSRKPTPDIDPAVLALARSIMRYCMAKHRHPDLSNIAPRLDVRVAKIEKPKLAAVADFWVMLRLPRRARIAIPLHGNPLFNRRGGELCPVVQLCTDAANHVSVHLTQDMAKPFAALKAAYIPKTDIIGIDFGLATLIATSEGTMFGRGLIADLTRIDRQLVGIARHRSRSGDKPRSSARYRKLIVRVRGMLRTRINCALNRIVAIHAPSELAVERLDFRSPHLSRRMNRLVQNCGRSVFRQKIVDLRDKYGITSTDVPSPYTSQECSTCHYVDRRNRRSQSEFECRFCGLRKHADVNAASVVAIRRSAGLGGKRHTKAAILDLLVRQHIERWRRPQGAVADPRFVNHYFREWASAARNALQGERQSLHVPRRRR